MNLQLLFENNVKSTSLFLSEEDALLVIRLSAAIDHESYKLIFEKLYNIITVYKYRKISYDLKDLTHTDMQSRTWYATSFLPRVIKNFGLDSKTEIVKSNNKYKNLSVDFLTKVGSNLGFKENIRNFDTREEAYSWLVDKKLAPVSAK